MPESSRWYESSDTSITSAITPMAMTALSRSPRDTAVGEALLRLGPVVGSFCHWLAMWLFGLVILTQYRQLIRAGCVTLPASTLIPLTNPGSSRQSPSASRAAYGAIAADSAWDEVRGTEPGMLVTQKCVTPSHWYVGASQVVGLRGLDAPALVDADVHDDAAGFHAADHVGRHHVRRARAGHEHRADHHVRGTHRVGDVGDVRIQAGDVRAHGARGHQLVAILVEHDDLGAEARGHQRGIAAGDAAAEHHDAAALRGRHTA